jgi:plastocyanin
MISLFRITLLLAINFAASSLAESSTKSTPSSTTSSAAQTHTVTVGKANNAFDPSTIQALPGDEILFQFFPTNHSVVRSEYGYPCVPYEDTAGTDAVGFFSGHFAVDTIQDDVRVERLCDQLLDQD